MPVWKRLNSSVAATIEQVAAGARLIEDRWRVPRGVAFNVAAVAVAADAIAGVSCRIEDATALLGSTACATTPRDADPIARLAAAFDGAERAIGRDGLAELIADHGDALASDDVWAVADAARLAADTDESRPQRTPESDARALDRIERVIGREGLRAVARVMAGDDGEQVAAAVIDFGRATCGEKGGQDDR
jgi:hypothetical protein